MTNALRLVAVLLPALAVAPAVRAEPPKLPVPAFDQSAVAKRGYFYVGGKYVGEAGKDIMQGQIFVEVLAPKDVRRPYPLVLIHGAAQTATNWMGTPDGRKGWADYFVEQGYVVYMIDQPMRGRSAVHPSDGPTRMFTVQNEEWQFTASETTEGTWPQAKKHTQWPGDGPNKGKKGDPIFDAFYATQVETVISNEETQRRTRMPAPRCSTRSGRRSCSRIRSRARSAGSSPTRGRRSSRRSSPSSRRDRRSRTPSTPPARGAPGDRPTSRSPMIRR